MDELIKGALARIEKSQETFGKKLDGIGEKVTKHGVMLEELNKVREREDERDKTIQEHGEALSRLEWVPNTVKGIIASLVALGVWIIKGVVGK